MLQLDDAKKRPFKELQQAYYNAAASRSRYESSRLVETSAQESRYLEFYKYDGAKANIS